MRTILILILFAINSSVFAWQSTICHTDEYFASGPLLGLHNGPTNTNNYCFNTVIHVVRDDNGDGGVQEGRVN